MRCANCGTTNDPGRRFCLECGSRLASACPSCGSENPPGAKFCGECGSALAGGPVASGTGGGVASDTGGPVASDTGGAAATAASRAGSPIRPEHTTPSAERRLVTILFADLVGFTPFSEERDPEEVRETLTRYFDVSREVIERYGGMVEKFIGDAVMAVWGTPVTHENDAERAVRAALELMDAVQGMDQGLQARAGVLTGEAAVTIGATGQGMVAGDLVNTTARVQTAAEPGTVLVGEATMRSAAEAVAFEPAGYRDLKGKASPLPVWRALRVVAERGGRGRSDGLEAPFVGRDIEFRLLKELFHATGRERRVRHISISGQGGIGKSRLAWELEKYLDGLVETVRWHHGRSPSYGTGITFWALGEMVRGRCGLVEHDDEATTRKRVAETVTRFVPEDSERSWIEAALLTLLGIGDAAASSEQLFPAWRSFFEHIARQGTTLLVFEDLQWADPGLLAFIDHVMSWSHDLPICIITLTRPELLEAQPGWGVGQRGFTSISLSPLDRESMESLLAGLVPGLPRRTSDRIVERADGIPLYAVETVRMLVADGRLVLEGTAYRPSGDLSELEVPEGLRSLVASRLDSLEPVDRQLLQSAAVLGHSFSTEAVASLTDAAGPELEAHLRILVRREMLTLRADPRSPERGQYAFAQELLRDVAYETLARDDRRSLHLAAARYFESLDTEELAGALAAQYLAAHRNTKPGPEADALGIQTRLALRAAAERALTLGSTEQAQHLFESALELTTAPIEQADLLESAARAAVMAGHATAAQSLLERAIDIYRAEGRRSSAARATASLVEPLLGSGWQLEAAVVAMREAAEEYSDLGLDEGLVHILAQLARIEMLRQEDLELAIATSDRALAMAEKLDLVATVADLLITRGTALSSAGRALEGLGAIEAGRRLAASEGLLEQQHRALLNMSAPLAERDPRAFLEASRAALELARRAGSRPWASLAVNNVAEAARITGDWDLAITELRREVESSAGDDLPRVQAALMLLQAERGEDVTDTIASLVEYVTAQLALGEPRWQTELDGLRAGVALPAGRYREAAHGFRAAAAQDAFNATSLFAQAALASLLDRDAKGAAAALQGLESTGSHGAVVKIDKRRASAGIAALEGRSDEALVGFRAVLEELRRMDLPYPVAMTGLVMCATLDALPPEVASVAIEARAIFEHLGAEAWLDRLDEALARSEVLPSAQAAPGRSSATSPASMPAS